MPAAIPLIAAGLGAAATVYGVNKQSKDQKSADASNRASIDKQNQDAWSAYLMQRGINAPGTPTGTIPTNGAPINSRLPLWATIQQTTPGAMVGGGAAIPAGVGATGAPRKFF